ncbi:MAG: LytTR family DNA-binding domain-containing protein [Lachnospiraceae bacterium]|nr:LytTR family DNA-binding domain-containing protein [Lachnospiraceae bacterium]
MLKIAIIEDEQIHTELLSGYLRTWSSGHRQPVSIQEFSSAESFLFIWEETNDFDILFVDIQMKEMNGIEMVRKVRERDDKIAIVFTTGITDYMETGYEVEALHYLLKPISAQKVGQCMDKLVTRRHKEEYILVHGKEETIRIPIEKITYVEARGHGCFIETYGRAGDCTQTEITENISELGERLKNHGFLRCHRSYICRIGSIHQIGRTEITFDSGSVIPVSRRMYAEVNRAFIEYFRNC